MKLTATEKEMKEIMDRHRCDGCGHYEEEHEHWADGKITTCYHEPYCKCEAFK
jgi:hypothetical protein